MTDEKQLSNIWKGVTIIGFILMFAGFLTPEDSSIRLYLIIGGLALIVLTEIIRRFVRKKIQNREEKKNT